MTRTQRVLEWVPLLVLLVVLAGALIGANVLLQRYGITGSFLESAIYWWYAGLVFAFGWPLRYWRGMRGLWLKSTPQILLVSLTGPFALILGMPL